MQTAPDGDQPPARQRRERQAGDRRDAEGQRRGDEHLRAVWRRRSRPAASARPGRRRCRGVPSE